MNAPLRRNGRCPGPRRSRGLAMTEFAISIPLLLLLMMATAEIGRLLFQYNTLMKAVRDGARYAATGAAVGTTRVVNISTAVRNETRNLVVTGSRLGTGTALLPGLTVANVTVTDVGSGFIQVAATYTYVPILGARLSAFGLGAPINLTVTLPASIVMRAL